jgi:hypothetical protein
MSGIREGETSPNWETKKVICLVAKETDWVTTSMYVFNKKEPM